MGPTEDVPNRGRDPRGEPPVLPSRAAEDEPRTWGDDLDGEGHDAGRESDDARLRADVPPHWS